MPVLFMLHSRLRPCLRFFMLLSRLRPLMLHSRLHPSMLHSRLRPRLCFFDAVRSRNFRFTYSIGRMSKF